MLFDLVVVNDVFGVLIVVLNVVAVVLNVAVAFTGAVVIGNAVFA